jgi:alkanesulfonate monooxygenase SsuD/methylene tetrahydromethanopterin reductase-like flavin-dependent oxidoreductase (luciferase family)
MTNETPRPISKLGFLTIGFFDEHDPFAGHESTLQIIELGERLGFDSAWLRDRHLQHGISSPVAVLAAASQRTSRIELGTAVIPLGLENPFRLAEDLATVDVLSRGRLNPGISVGVPTHFDDIKEHLYPDSWATENFTTERVERLLHNLRGGDVSTFSGTQGIETFSTRIQPLGEAARASQGLVVIPTDTATAEQKVKYHAYAEGRFGRTTKPQGPQRMLFAPDLVGDSEQIAESLRAHAGFRAVDELVFALPFTLDHEDYVQILTDMATVLGPLLGWKPDNLDTVLAET